jgi:hypothetical protein
MGSWQVHTLARGLLKIFPRARGNFNEDHLSSCRHQSGKIQKAEEGCQEPFVAEHRATLHGVTAPPGTYFRGRIEALRAMNDLRQKIARSTYVAALAAAMVAWVWVLFEGVEWVLGV